MKKVFAFVTVAGMVALASCGGAEEAAKKLQDSLHTADSVARAKHVADSTRQSDSINKDAADKKAAADNKHISDSIAMAAHDDSVKRHLIKPKK